jgi:hypothetical protein
MRPAFASTQQAAAFAFLLLVLLLLPVLLTKSVLPPREQIYAWSGWDSTGPHPYHQQLIFEEKGDIDIAFIGSSQITHAIDTPEVQEKLSAMLGRPATVRTLGWGGAGFDALYITTKDLLQNRRVKMMVIYDECQTYDQPNSLAPNFFRLADDADSLAGLPLRLKLDYYDAAILGVPKNLLCLLRSALPADMSPAKMDYVDGLYDADNIVLRLGSIASHHGFNFSALFDDYGPFIPYTPDNGITPSDVAVYSPETQADFQFSGPPVPDWQLRFGRKFTALARQYGVKLVLLHLPLESDRRSTVIQEREFWPDALRADITMMGIPPATLFKGMSDEDVRKLYCDTWHLNKNGQEYYTSLITPALLKIYAAQIHP